jgi:hypothetical protein
VAELDHLAELIGLHATHAELDRWVRRATGETLKGAFAGEGDSVETAARAVLETLAGESAGNLDRFLREVYRSRELQPRLVAEIDGLNRGIRETLNRPELDFKFGSAGRAQATAPLRTLLGRYGGNMLSGDWYEELGLAQGRVCRIERMGQSFGTGFLVGPSAILTNFHVQEQAGTAPGLVARFGFRLRLDGSVDRGEEVPVVPEPIMTRPPTQGERDGQPDQPPLPGPQDLDYALMSLGSPYGDSVGSFAFDGLSRDLQKDEPLIVIQYPAQAFLSVSIDTRSVRGLNQDGRRLRYNNLTEQGSSGSPCLSMDLRLVALHHFGDPGWQGNAFRQGIPARLIRDDITGAGFADHLAGAA